MRQPTNLAVVAAMTAAWVVAQALLRVRRKPGAA